MSEYVSWIKAELAKAFPQADLSEGVDLDGDGELDASERIADLDGNGVIGDKADWEQFLLNNEAEIRSIDGIFKWSAAFETDNPVNDLLSIESDIVPPEQIENAYQKIEKSLDSLEGVLEIFAGATPREMMWFAYMSIFGYYALVAQSDDNSLFSQNLNGVGLDCDTSSMFILAMAHELGWPVHLVGAPEHVFVRWDDGEGEKFNMDFGVMTPDDYYVADFGISQSEIDSGVYLKNFSDEELLALFNFNVGNALSYEKQYQEAIEYFDRTIDLDPNEVQAYNNRAINKVMLGKLKEAHKDFEKALEFDIDSKVFKKNMMLTNLIPDMQLTFQPRTASGSDAVMNWRFALGATWPVIKVSDEIDLGPQLDIGYGAGTHEHMLDLAGDFTFTYKDDNGSSLTAQAGVGYNFPLSGVHHASPLPEGAFFQYGLRYAFPMKSSFGIGISLLVQHNIAKPSKYAILPGIGVQYKMW